MKKVVKVLSLLVLAFVMCGCVPHLEYSIVIKVEKTTTQWYTTEYKYIVTTDNSFSFCTNTQFNVGDTIQITKKN